jgi:hypothetical protein
LSARDDGGSARDDGAVGDGWRRSGGGWRRIAGAEFGDEGEVDVAAFGVDADDADLDFVVELDDVLDALDALAGLELGDVDHAAEAEEIDEGAVRDDARDLAEGDGADAR